MKPFNGSCGGSCTPRRSLLCGHMMAPNIRFLAVFDAFGIRLHLLGSESIENRISDLATNFPLLIFSLILLT